MGFEVNCFKVDGFKVDGFKVDGFKVDGTVDSSGLGRWAKGVEWALTRLTASRMMASGSMASKLTASKSMDSGLMASRIGLQSRWHQA